MTNDAQVKRSEMGVLTVSTLNSQGKVPASQLPSYVDDVIELPGEHQILAFLRKDSVIITLAQKNKNI